MNTFFYLIVFIIGTLFGSFYTLAVYRIPTWQDILYTRSYCPNCGHKLGFFELIPIISYIAIGGKCVHCGLKIRIRYLVLEVLSGIVFLLLALSLKIDVYNIDINSIIYLAFLAIYVSVLFIISGIDKENIKIERSVLLFGLVHAICFMIYVCVSGYNAMHTYIIVLAMVLILLALDTFFMKKKLHENYSIGILILSMYMLIFSGFEMFYYTVALTLVLIFFKELYVVLKNRAFRKSVIDTNEDKKLNIPIGLYLSISNIILMILYNFLEIRR